MARDFHAEIAELKRRFAFPMTDLLGPPRAWLGDDLARAEFAALQSRGKRQINLNLVAPVIIVPAPTGIVYRNQVGGHSCMQMYLEGFLIPVVPRDQEDPFTGRLPDIFNPLLQEERRWSRKFATEHFPEIEHQINDSAELAVGPLRCIEHDDNDEAWIWVRFQHWELGVIPPEEDADLLGVLTWCNSD